MKVKCEKCRKTFELDQIDPVTHDNWKIQAGSVVPFGQCRACGGYCREDKERKAPGWHSFTEEATAQLASLLTQQQRDELEKTGYVTMFQSGYVKICKDDMIKKVPQLEQVPLFPEPAISKDVVLSHVKRNPVLSELLSKQTSEDALNAIVILVNRLLSDK